MARHRNNKRNNRHGHQRQQHTHAHPAHPAHPRCQTLTDRGCCQRLGCYQRCCRQPRHGPCTEQQAQPHARLGQLYRPPSMKYCPGTAPPGMRWEWVLVGGPRAIQKTPVVPPQHPPPGDAPGATDTPVDAAAAVAPGADATAQQEQRPSLSQGFFFKRSTAPPQAPCEFVPLKPPTGAGSHANRQASFFGMPRSTMRPPCKRHGTAMHSYAIDTTSADRHHQQAGVPCQARVGHCCGCTNSSLAAPTTATPPGSSSDAAPTKASQCFSCW